MPKKAGGSGGAENVAGSGSSSSGGRLPAFTTELPMPRQPSQNTYTFQDTADADDSLDSVGSAEDLVASSFAKAPAFAPPRPLSEVSFDDALPQQPPPPPPAPFRSLAETNFDNAKPDPQRPAPPPLPFPGAGGVTPPPGSQVASAAGMGISITGAPGLGLPPKQTPAQLSAANQSLRIRLLRADGKPFDGPEITTGPKQDAKPATPSRTEFDTPRGPKKQAPKVVVKTGPLERAGHALAVLLISAVGIVPLAYLVLRSVHDREDKLAAKITAPTKMNVLDGTSEAYLGAMVVVLLVVAVLYRMRLKRRRER